MTLNLSPEAQKGFQFLEKANPDLAERIRKTSQVADGAATSDDVLNTDTLLSGDELASTPNIPEDTEDTTSGLVDADARTAQVNGAGAIASSAQTLQDLREERQKAAQEAQKSAEQFRTIVSEAEGEDVIRKESRAEYGVTKKEGLVSEQEAKVVTLQNQVSNLQKQKQDEIRQAESRLASNSQIQLEKQRISREYDRHIADVSANLNAQAAVLQARQGNLQRAQRNAKDAINAKLRTQENEINRMKAVATTANDWYETLDESTQDYIDNLIDAQETDLKNKKDRMKANIDLAQEAWNRGIDFEITGDELADTSPADLAEQLGPLISEKEAEEDTGRDITPTETERGIAKAENEFARLVSGREGNIVGLNNYLQIRASVAINPDEFDARFSKIYLSETDQKQVSETESGIPSIYDLPL